MEERRVREEGMWRERLREVPKRVRKDESGGFERRTEILNKKRNILI